MEILLRGFAMLVLGNNYRPPMARFLNSFSEKVRSFSDEEEAAKAYDAAARKYHGEFACVNFPERSRP